MAIFCSILDPKQMALSLSKTKTSSQRSGLAGGKWRSHLSESALAGVIGRTDRGPGRFLLRRASATLYQPRFPLYHAWWLSLYHPAGTKWKDRRADLAISRLWSQATENSSCARIQKLELLGKSSLFLGAKMRQGFIFSYQLAGKNNRVFCASAFSFFEAFYKESFRFLLYTLYSSNKKWGYRKWKSQLIIQNALRNCHNKVLVTANKHFSSFFIRNS